MIASWLQLRFLLRFQRTLSGSLRLALAPFMDIPALQVWSPANMASLVRSAHLVTTSVVALEVAANPFPPKTQDPFLASTAVTAAAAVTPTTASTFLTA